MWAGRLVLPPRLPEPPPDFRLYLKIISIPLRSNFGSRYSKQPMSTRLTKRAAVLSGVANYARQRKWRLIIVNPNNAKSLRQFIRATRPLGCIVDGANVTASNHPPLSPAAFGSTPVVYYSIDSSTLPKTCSRVNPDSAEVGRLAAKELLALPVASFGYVPWPRKAYWCAVRRAVALIEEKFAEGLMARDVVAVLGGSRRTAERRFREATGKSILDAINDLRFERAKVLLRKRTTDISAIADACGWSSPGYLRRIFRQRTGLSMSAWRDRNPAPGASVAHK